MRKTFFNLEPERRERLLEACAREFALKGYELASTNAIVRECGISKGSFFKYFDSKESAYLYLVRSVLRDLGDLQGSRAAYSSPDIVSRAEELFAGHMEYARRSPVRYMLSLRALLESSSPLHAKVIAIKKGISRNTAGNIYDGVDWAMYRYPKNDVIEFLSCVDNGLRHAALELLGKKMDIRTYEIFVTRRLALARRVLSTGIYARRPRRKRYESEH
jgi:TetR/AcrR family transcriptional regulator